MAWRFHNATYVTLVLSILLFIVGVGFAGFAFLEFDPAKAVAPK